MKRSTKIGLGAAGVVLVASAWSLMGGEDDKLVYNDAAACRADGQMSDEQCDARFREARDAHARNAKRFPSQNACEGEFGPGRCEGITVNNTPMWVPALAGIMLARRFARGGGAAEPLLAPTRQACPPGSTVEECRPASRSGGGVGGRSSGSYGRRTYSTTSGGTVTAGGTGATKVGVTSRGGFGSTGRGGFSSGG